MCNQNEDDLHEKNTFTPHEFNLIRELFIRLTGNRIGKEKQNLLESRLSKRIHHLQISPKDYISKLRQSDHEQEILISELTTHKTDWFREYEHFQFLESAIQKDWINTHGNPLYLWSAASSTGEEVYSLAIFLSELGHSFKILGTDISENCLLHARQGIYSKETIEKQVNSNLRSKYFLRGTGPNLGFYRIQPRFTHSIKWRKHNLTKPQSLNSSILFDVIFLRNALIYFDRETCNAILQNVIQNLKPGGFIFIGLSETIDLTDHLQLRQVANSVYRRETGNT